MFRSSSLLVAAVMLLPSLYEAFSAQNYNNGVWRRYCIMMTRSSFNTFRIKTTVWNSESESGGEELTTSTQKKQSLEEKMKSWEASEEEIKAATLGGIVPQGGGDRERAGAFDVGLYIAFPIMVITGLLFALFPFIMGNLDVDSVGPPPTV